MDDYYQKLLEIQQEEIREARDEAVLRRLGKINAAVLGGVGEKQEKTRGEWNGAILQQSEETEISSEMRLYRELGEGTDSERKLRVPDQNQGDAEENRRQYLNEMINGMEMLSTRILSRVQKQDGFLQPQTEAFTQMEGATGERMPLGIDPEALSRYYERDARRY